MDAFDSLVYVDWDAYLVWMDEHLRRWAPYEYSTEHNNDIRAWADQVPFDNITMHDYDGGPCNACICNEEGNFTDDMKQRTEYPDVRSN